TTLREPQIASCSTTLMTHPATLKVQPRASMSTVSAEAPLPPYQSCACLQRRAVRSSFGSCAGSKVIAKHKVGSYKFRGQESVACRVLCATDRRPPKCHAPAVFAQARKIRHP